MTYDAGRRNRMAMGGALSGRTSEALRVYNVPCEDLPNFAEQIDRITDIPNGGHISEVRVHGNVKENILQGEYIYGIDLSFHSKSSGYSKEHKYSVHEVICEDREIEGTVLINRLREELQGHFNSPNLESEMVSPNEFKVYRT
ncbi:hypothetical protein COU54_03765 [Candidatus Pacearchaeota archaeon CG10_big_fil_rev_8_21_14_0_10_31_24]|nr:MAG: hypothetical protein COU54_03765 [Candidatus Pacearchaeota archaeon CG10_big_fil_rev_8_21_14_0_10_31_24]